MKQRNRGIDHLGIAVQDLPNAVASYHGVLGFDILGGGIVEKAEGDGDE